MMDQTEGDVPAPLVLAHSSDLHIGAGRLEIELAALRSVVDTAVAAGAHVLVLAGDIFDHNRLGKSELELVRAIVARATLDVITLPGNHDCLLGSAPYAAGCFDGLPNTRVLGDPDEVVVLPHLDATFWGRAHRDHLDMDPLTSHPGTASRWHIALVHGHALEVPGVASERGWTFAVSDLATLQADYVALGHWDVWTDVSGTDVPAYYSGSPYVTGTINVARLSASGTTVERQALRTSVKLLADR